jgi:16S rRNA (cytosine1402-N4)-methyltransferase
MTHRPVFLQPAIDFLQVQPKAWYLDATFGAGGHTQAIIARGGRVLAFEYEHASYQRAKEQFAPAIQAGQLVLEHKNFTQLESVLKAHAKLITSGLAGAIFDLGTSTDQLMGGQKGLSVYQDGVLDMRLDDRVQVTAQDLLLALSEPQLAQLFREYGGESYARPIARAIIQQRHRQGQTAFATSGQLARLIVKIKPARGKIHPATKVFQALRIAVNCELDNLTQVLPLIFKHLCPQGRLVVIAFHEGEDRPVKLFFREQAKNNQAKILTSKPLLPNQEEQNSNPRSRSAKMRVLEKI